MYEGKDQDAIPFLLRAIRQSPSESLWWMDLGIAYGRANLPAESQRAFERAVEETEKVMARDPRDGVVRSRLAFLCARLRDRNRAESEIAQALQLSPESNVARETAVWTYDALGKRDDALAILRTSGDDVLMDVARWPELAELRKDSRFQSMSASRQAGK